MAVEAEASGAETAPAYHLSVHELINGLQQGNGLRFGDYARYRRFCTRKLRRLRVTHGLQCAKGKSFHGYQLSPDERPSATHLLVLLLLAERAWAFAMDLKDSGTEDDSWAKAAEKRRFLRRLAKAHNWADQLMRYAAAAADERTKRETQAYARWMAGHLALERERFQQALDSFRDALQLYGELSRQGSVEDADLFSQRIEALSPALRWCAYNLGDSGLANDLLGDVLGSPPSAAADGELAAKLAEASIRDSAEGRQKLRWGGRELSIIDSQTDAVRLSIGKAFKAEKELEDHLGRPPIFATAQQVAARIGLPPLSASAKGDATAGGESADELEKVEAELFGSIFDDFGDAERAVDKEVSKLKGMAAGERVEQSLTAASTLKAFLAWRRMQHMLHRNLRLAHGLEVRWETEARAQTERLIAGKAAAQEDESSGTVEDLVHMYQIMQTLSRDMEELPTVKDHDELLNRSQATQAILRCYRCFYLAESYLKLGKARDAHRLFDHAQNLTGDAIEAGRAAADAVRDAGEEGAEASSKIWESTVTGMVRMEQKCVGAKARILAIAFLNKQREQQLQEDSDGAGALPTMPGERDLLERLDDFDDGGGEETGWQLQSVPPKLRALPGKPIFLDIAGQFLDFPNLDEKAGVVSDSQKAGGADPGSGWLSWLTG